MNASMLFKWRWLDESELYYIIFILICKVIVLEVRYWIGGHLNSVKISEQPQKSNQIEHTNTLTLEARTNKRTNEQ